MPKNGQDEGRSAPFMAPAPPALFVDRDSVAQEILPLLLAEESRDVALTTALRGAWGFGKTTMAAWLCHHHEVRQRFSDGILWVELGQDLTPRDVIAQVAYLCIRLRDEPPMFSTPRIAGDHLGELIGERRMLLVIDDVCGPNPVRRTGLVC